MIAVSADTIDKALEIAEAYDIEFSILADPGLVMIDAFGVRHTDGGMGGTDIARPATFILDRNGRIVWRDMTEDWRIRVRPGRLLEELAALP